MNWTREQLAAVQMATQKKLAASGAAFPAHAPFDTPAPPATLSATARMLDEHEAAAAAPERTNRGNDGRAFQSEMERTAGAYQSRRVAMLRKVDPPVKVFWRFDAAKGRKVQQVVFMANPFVDFVGSWQALGGRMLAVEAKSTATHRLPFKRHGGLTEEQLANLRTWAASGAATCLVWQWAGSVCLWTPAMMEAPDARGDKSLVFAAGLRVPRGVGSVVWDFLPVLAGALPAGNT